MNLYQALDLNQDIFKKGFCLAFIGSGGKTTALFTLARQILGSGGNTVWISTTTHLSVDELKQADQVIHLEKESDWDNMVRQRSKGIVLVCGSETSDARVGGPAPFFLERLHQLTTQRQEPLLLEADGSRRKPIKAPANHEPVIPSYVDVVMNCVGLSGVEKQLSDEFVHRPEQFARLSGLEAGDRITAASLAQVLIHPAGGLKNIPPDARLCLLLNQADRLTNLEVPQEITSKVQHVYSKIIVAALEKEPEQVRYYYQPTAGIILAAGGASRFGAPKQILTWHGIPLVQHVMHTAINGGLYPIKIIIGAYQPQVQSVVDKFPEVQSNQVEIVFNPDWEAGLSTSIRAGLRSLPEGTGSAVFLLADQPQIPADLIQELRRTRARTQAWIVSPEYKGQRANPVLFGWELFDQLNALEGDTGGRALIQRSANYPMVSVSWDSSNLVWDLDEPSDYQSLMETDKL